MDKHIIHLSKLQIIFGVLMIFFTLVYYLFIYSCLLPSDYLNVLESIKLKKIMQVNLIAFIFYIASIIGGIELKKYKSWARTLLLILGCLYLFNFPVGTVLGIYTIWVLMDKETKVRFSKRYKLNCTSQEMSDNSLIIKKEKVIKKSSIIHVKFLSIIHIIFNSLCVLIAFNHFSESYQNGPAAEGLKTESVIMIGKFVHSDILLFLFSILGILGGIELMKLKKLGRILVLIIGFIHLINRPVGTVLGIYTLWVLLKKDTIRLFAEGPKMKV